ncbi:MAG: hypothetical protein ACI9XO_003753 [Paraglaciecola sp.]|jgi:hypothetical protein
MKCFNSVVETVNLLKGLGNSLLCDQLSLQIEVECKIKK